MEFLKQFGIISARRTGPGIIRSFKIRAPFWRLALWVAITTSVVSLLYLHALLFVERLSDLSIFEPAVAAKWTAGLLILTVLFKLGKAGSSLFTGRRALVIWLLVLLLHIQIPTPIGSDLGTDFDPQQNAFLAYLLPALISITICLAICSGRFSRLARRSGSLRIAAILLRRRLPGRLHPLAGFSPAILSRPPPA